MPGGEFDSRAHSVSEDGSVIVGYGHSELGKEAFRWTAAGGMQGLGDLSGEEFSSIARSVSADGSVIVGYGATDLGEAAFIWDLDSGLRDLKGVLTDDYGLDLTGWTLLRATSISPDGQSVVGLGINPDGNREAWLATVPEPSTLALLGMGAIGLLAVGWWKRRKRA